MKKMENKTFYVVSALRGDSSALGYLIRHETEKLAVDHAKSVIGRRSREGKNSLSFYILKIVALVEPQNVPVKVKRFKGR